MRYCLPLLTLIAVCPAPLWAETTASETTVVAAPYITVVTVQDRTLRDVVFASGLIGAVEQVQVAPLVEGQPIESLLADVGDLVAEGQVLARLSTSSLTLQKAQLTASLAAARAAISQAEAQAVDAQSAADEANRVAARSETLLAQGTYSQANADKITAAAVSANSRVTIATQSLESARANLALVEAQMSNVDLMLSRTEVKAPVGGEITARNAQIGTIASAAMPMFSMIRDSALELRADVAEGDVLRLQAGQSVSLHLSGDATARKGTVRLIEPSIDPVTRMGRVRISIDEASGVRPGMYAMAEVLVAERSTPAAPITAIGASAGGPTSLELSGDTVGLVAVTTGIRDAGWIEITSGLASGDQIVAKAGAFVRDGDRITPVQAKD
ncbi:MAG: efflux RND transporter periplasmic adaptor subunit [Rhodobacteraceae bacterium]|nr:efflux RND transporter periplasmic adaptor subunit [Paracoccaceae bacterium]